jgi:hypothetical protein
LRCSELHDFWTRGEASELLFGSDAFSRVAALDRFWLHAQHHSYTNDAPPFTMLHTAPEIPWQGFT